MIGVHAILYLYTVYRMDVRASLSDSLSISETSCHPCRRGFGGADGFHVTTAVMVSAREDRREFGRIRRRQAHGVLRKFNRLLGPSQIAEHARLDSISAVATRSLSDLASKREPPRASSKKTRSFFLGMKRICACFQTARTLLSTFHPLSACIRFKCHPIHTKLHSLWTESKPRSRNCLNP